MKWSFTCMHNVCFLMFNWLNLISWCSRLYEKWRNYTVQSHDVINLHVMPYLITINSLVLALMPYLIAIKDACVVIDDVSGLYPAHAAWSWSHSAPAYMGSQQNLSSDPRWGRWVYLPRRGPGCYLLWHSFSPFKISCICKRTTIAL